MKTLLILSKISEEIKSLYSSISDFSNWVPMNCDFEFIIDDECYCVDFSIKGYKDLSSEVSLFKKKQGKWIKDEINSSTKQFIEFNVNALIPFWFDQLEKEEAEDLITKEEAKNDSIKMHETYRSLQAQLY